MALAFHNKSILLSVLSTLLSLSLSTARDTITPTQPLADNETLVSSGGTFALGFFTPSNSERRYLGVWHNNIKVQTVVWVANREDPVVRSTGQLSVSANGTIMISNGSEPTVVWSVGTRIGLITNPVIQLLDTGNFVLKQEGDSTQNNYGWQSFDYPTDTLLPGMKLGFDEVAGLNRSLTAWKGADDPSHGEYYAAMVIDSSPEMYLFSRSSKVWRSGPWDGNQLSGLPNVDPYYSFVNNNKQVTLSYNEASQSQPIAPILKVTRSGKIQWLDWVSSAGQWATQWDAPSDPCDNIDACGPYGICGSWQSPMSRCMSGFVPKNPSEWVLKYWSGGCVRLVGLDCRNGTDGFLGFETMKLPESSTSSVNKTFSLDECRVECLTNCSCTAYALISGAGCVIWVTDLLDVVQLSSTESNIYIRLAADSLASHSQPPMAKRRAKRRTIVAIVLSLLSGALLLSCFIFFLWRRKKRRIVSLGRTNFFSDKLDEDDRGKDPDLPLFTFGTIAAATESFSAENKLGQGGFGPVYKGTLGGDKVIAVKRLAKSSQQGAEEFKNEVILIAKLQNRNLVRLLGCCIHGEERMLVYEYMPNKSLDAFLFEKEKAVLLEWQTRYQIIVGITRGLLYLHHDSRYRIIHRDLKASNILLDKEMNPKISDFGLARLFGGDATGYNTKKVVGTYGYMSPEYAMEGIFSLKSDVYSFGVLLLEIISGRKNRGSYAFSQHLNLVAHTWSLWNEGKSLDLVDEAMNSNFPKNDVLKCIKIGLLCVQDHPEDRPLMSSVIEMLGADITSLRQPKQPTFLARMDLELGHVSNRKDSRTSNELTVTLDGR